jgi:hypothetical protein
MIASASVVSGVIGGSVTIVSFAVSGVDRVAGKAGAAATFTFTPTAGGALSVGGRITLNYPSGFFSATPTPFIFISGNVNGSCTSTASQIVITTSSGSLVASASVTVTLTGITMGSAPTAGGSVTLQTSVDQTASVSVASGVIGGSSNLTSFLIAQSDRVVNRGNVMATFSFIPTAGGALSASSTITLMYPSGFFAAGGTPPSVLLSGAAANAGATVISRIVITLSTGTVAASAAATITLLGLTMGSAPTPGGNVTVSTSRDLLLSPALASGDLGGGDRFSYFQVADSDRVVNKPNVSVTFSFNTTAGGALSAGNSITLAYPSGFFAAGVTA